MSVNTHTVNKLWDSILSKYSQNMELPYCLYGLTDDFYEFRFHPYSVELINQMVDKHPMFSTLSRTMRDELEKSILRHDHFRTVNRT